MKLTIGYTQVDQDRNYCPFIDGYHTGATQDTLAIEVPDLPGMSPMDWAEAVFVATNRPTNPEHASDFITEVEVINDALSGHHRRSLAVGDTVTADNGTNRETWACAWDGWDLLPEAL